MKRSRSSKHVDLAHEMRLLREEMAFFRQDVLSIRPARSSVSTVALARLYGAIHLVIGPRGFTAAHLVEAASETDSDSVFLREQLCSLLGPNFSVRRLTSFLASAKSRAGEWQLEIFQDRTREGRLFSVTKVTSFVTKSNQQCGIV